MSPAPLSRERTPDRPGPGPLPEAFLRAVDLQIGRRLDGLLTGEHRTAALGMGTELAQVREWAPGDDVRRIDWNATARSNEVQVRVDVAERALTSWVLLDVSPSMRFGTADRRKWDVAEGVAVATGHLASRRGNRIGVATFGGAESLVLPPRQGRVGLLAVLLAVRREPETERVGATSIGSALTQIAKIARQRSLVVVVSDFRGPPDWRSSAAGGRLAARRRSGRDPGSEGAGAAEHRTRLARRSGDGPQAARRHLPPPAARAIRRSRGDGSRRPCPRIGFPRRAASDALDGR